MNFAAIRKFYEDGGYVKPRAPTAPEKKKMALFASQNFADGGEVKDRLAQIKKSLALRPAIAPGPPPIPPGVMLGGLRAPMPPVVSPFQQRLAAGGKIAPKEDDSRVEELLDVVEKQSEAIDKLVKVVTQQTEVLAAPQEIVRDENNRIKQVKRSVKKK